MFLFPAYFIIKNDRKKYPYKQAVCSAHWHSAERHLRFPSKKGATLFTIFQKTFLREKFSALLTRSRDAANRTSSACRDERGRLADAQRSNTARATTEEEDQLIFAAVVAVDPFISVEEIREAPLSQHLGKNYPKTTSGSSRRSKPCNGAKATRYANHQGQTLRDLLSNGGWKIGEDIITNEFTFNTRWDHQQRVWRPMKWSYECLFSPPQRRTHFRELLFSCRTAPNNTTYSWCNFSLLRYVSFGGDKM